MESWHWWRQGRTSDVILALLYGVFAGAASWIGMHFVRTDLGLFLGAVEIFREGGDPYRALLAAKGMYFYYPLPTAIFLVPFTHVSLAWAGAVLMGGSGALLAYGLLRHGQIAFFALTSASMLFACRFGQFSPLLTAAVLLPGFGFVFALKPNLGVSCLAGWPRPGAIAAGLGVALASLLVIPEWPWLWWESLQDMPLHPAPVSVAGGAIVLVALLRWRRPEARLLCVLACVPQVMLFADQLPLLLVAQSRREQAVQWALGWVGVVGAYRALLPDQLLMEAAYPYVVWTMYIPALIMVLRRPNRGTIPSWLERVSAGAPAWLRGEPEPV